MQEFKSKIIRARQLAQVDNQEFWNAYSRGLRRLYHGEKFGTEDEHKIWMSQEGLRGAGYKKGFSGSDIESCNE
jgi:hypothetical protein